MSGKKKTKQADKTFDSFQEFVKESSDEAVAAAYDTPLYGILDTLENQKDLDPEVAQMVDKEFWNLLNTDEEQQLHPSLKEKLREKLRAHAETNPNWLSEMIEGLSQDDLERIENLETRLDDLETTLQKTSTALAIISNANKIMSDSILAWMDKQRRFNFYTCFCLGLLACLLGMFWLGYSR